MKIGEQINKKVAKAIKTVLNRDHYKKIAESNKTSVSTINNLLDGRQKITKRNKKVAEKLQATALKESQKIVETLNEIPF